MQLGFADVLPAQAWVRIDIEDPRARELADRHYSRQTPGAEGFVGPGRRFLLGHFVHDVLRAIWAVCYSLDPNGELQFRNTIFRNESPSPSSLLIAAALETSYEVFTIRYGALPAAPLTSEIDIEATRARRGRHRPPGYCYERACWTWVRSTLPGHGRRARAIYEAPRPTPCHSCGTLGLPRWSYGVLCKPCWTSVLARLRQLLGRPSRWELTLDPRPDFRT